MAGRRLTLLISACTVLLATGLAWPQVVSAHALAQSSVPAAGAVLNQSPPAVTITFGEAPDPKLSSIAVIDTSGTSWTSGATRAVAGNPVELTVNLKPLGRGVYTVTWRTVSAVDGHLASGSFAFGVGVAPTSAQTTGAVASPPPSPLAVAARLLLFAGLMVALGAALVLLVVLVEPRRSASLLLMGGAVVAAFGSFLVIEAQRSAAGIGWGDVFGSSLGTVLIERAVFAVLLLIGSVGVARLGRVVLRRLALAGTAAAALAAMAVDVFSSHAGAESPVAINELLQWAHIAAAGSWMGGLATLLVLVRGRPSAEKLNGIKRFSFIAGIAIAVVAATGVVRAVLEIGTWSALFSTVFGQLVIIKTALLVVLIGLGALNRFRNVPLSGLRLRGLRAVGSAELIVATAALLVAAALVNVAPPVAAQTARASQRPLVVTGSDPATTVKASLSLSPGTPGFNTFTLTLRDYDTGSPVTPALVKLSFSSLDLPTVGASTLGLKRAAPGVFSAQGANLSLAGRWRITALLEQGAASTEVDLQVTLPAAPQQIDVQHFGGGLPTLYTIHVGAGQTVQVYVDPDHTGPSHFHATFFDAKGQELPIASITVAVSHGGATPTSLMPQRLDAGHFAADVNLAAGTSHFTLVAATASGGQLTATIDLTPAK